MNKQKKRQTNICRFDWNPGRVFGANSIYVPLSSPSKAKVSTILSFSSSSVVEESFESLLSAMSGRVSSIRRVLVRDALLSNGALQRRL